MSDVNAYLKDMTGNVVGTSGNPLYVNAVLSTATIDVDINAEDIEIGAVEIKDNDSDVRLEVATDATGGHNSIYVMSGSLASEVTLAYASTSLGIINTSVASIWNRLNTGTIDTAANQDGAWYVTATQDKAWNVSATVSGAVNASQSGVWLVSATVTAPASGVWTREAIHPGTSIFNTALPATSTDWFTPIGPTYSPAYFNVHVAVATAGKLSYSRTSGGATVVCDFNSGVNLTASAEYAFTIPALTGDTISLRYDKFGYNILSCYVFEKGA